MAGTSFGGGTLASELGLLSRCTVLDLSSHASLSGTLPATLGNMTALARL